MNRISHWIDVKIYATDGSRSGVVWQPVQPWLAWPVVSGNVAVWVYLAPRQRGISSRQSERISMCTLIRT